MKKSLLSIVIVFMLLISVVSVFAEGEPGEGKVMVAVAPAEEGSGDEQWDDIKRQITSGGIRSVDSDDMESCFNNAACNSEMQTYISDPGNINANDLSNLYNKYPSNVDKASVNSWIDSNTNTQDISTLYNRMKGNSKYADFGESVRNQLSGPPTKELTSDVERDVLAELVCNDEGTADPNYKVNCGNAVTKSDSVSYSTDASGKRTLSYDGITLDLSDPALQGATIKSNGEIENLQTTTTRPLTVNANGKSYDVGASQGGDIRFQQTKDGTRVTGDDVRVRSSDLGALYGNRYDIELDGEGFTESDTTITIDSGSTLAVNDPSTGKVTGRMTAASSGNTRSGNGLSLNLASGKVTGSGSYNGLDVIDGPSNEVMYTDLTTKGGMRGIATYSDGAGTVTAQLTKEGVTSATYRDVFGGTLSYKTEAELPTGHDITKIHEFTSKSGVTMTVGADPTGISGPYVNHQTSFADGVGDEYVNIKNGDGSKFSMDIYQQGNDDINTFDGKGGKDHISIRAAVEGDVEIDVQMSLMQGERDIDGGVMSGQFFANDIDINVLSGSDPGGSISLEVDSLPNREIEFEINEDGTAEWVGRRYWMGYNPKKADDVKHQTHISVNKDAEVQQVVEFPDFGDNGYEFGDTHANGERFSTDDSKSERNAAYNQFLKEAAAASAIEDVEDQAEAMQAAEEKYEVAQAASEGDSTSAGILKEQLQENKATLDEKEDALDDAKREHVSRVMGSRGAERYESDEELYAAAKELTSLQQEIDALEEDISTGKSEYREARSDSKDSRRDASRAENALEDAQGDQYNTAKSTVETVTTAAEGRAEQRYQENKGTATDYPELLMTGDEGDMTLTPGEYEDMYEDAVYYGDMARSERSWVDSVPIIGWFTRDSETTRRIRYYDNVADFAETMMTASSVSGDITVDSDTDTASSSNPIQDKLLGRAEDQWSDATSLIPPDYVVSATPETPGYYIDPADPEGDLGYSDHYSRSGPVDMTYTVQSGDSPANVAKQYNVPDDYSTRLSVINAVQSEHNGGYRDWDSNPLRPGETLTLPYSVEVDGTTYVLK